jgi:hypothetical protein
MSRWLFGILITVTACGDDAASDAGTDGAESSDAGGPDGGGIPDGGGGPCGEITTWADGLAPSQELHVGPGQTYGSIGEAAQDAMPGSAIVVHEGTYPGGEYLSGLAGTATMPIWIGGAAGEARPIISGGAEALHLSSVRYLIIHDLEVTGTTQNGINCDDSGDYANMDATRWIIFRDLYIHDLGSGGNQDCLKLSGVNDYVVLDSELSNCGGGGSGSLIDHVGCHRGLIARNRFHDTSGNAVQCKGGSEDIEIRANDFERTGARSVNMGGSTGFEFFRPPLSMVMPNYEARDIRVVANVFVGGDAPIAFVGCVECLAASNTIIDPEVWVARILQETVTAGAYEFLPASDSRFVNNLVYFSAGTLSTHVNVGPDTDPGSFEFTTNLWYAHDDPGSSTPSLPVAETGALIGMDPGLSGTHEISAGSPAAGAGATLGEVRSDRAGRCYGDPPSIGAFEVP